MNCSWPLPCTPANLQVGNIEFWMLVPFQFTTGFKKIGIPGRLKCWLLCICHLHIFLPPWPLFTPNLPKTQSLGQHKRQLTRSGICIGVWLKIFFSELLQRINIQQPQRWGKNGLKPHSAKYQILVFLSVGALPSYLSVLYRTVWTMTFMTHCPLLCSFLRL